MEQICFLCAQMANVVRADSGKDNFYITCDRCGEYEVTRMLLTRSKDSDFVADIPALSGLCRELKETDQPAPVLMTTNLANLASQFPAPNMEDLDAKLEKLLASIKRRSKYFGQIVELSRDRDYPLAYAKNDDEFFAFIDQLAAMDLLDLKATDTMTKFVRLSADGWKRFSRMTTEQKTKQAFIATWFDETMDGSIQAIKEAIEECGFEPVCIKTELFKETIMDKALGELRRSRFTVIDLTGGRGSVFYEAGFAKALDIEAIYVYRAGEAQSGSKLEFYVKHYQCHAYSSPEELKEIITNAVRARIK